jgi:hypothetical protein
MSNNSGPVTSAGFDVVVDLNADPVDLRPLARLLLSLVGRRPSTERSPNIRRDSSVPKGSRRRGEKTQNTRAGRCSGS